MTHNRKFQKNRKKIQKTKQYHYGFISSQNWFGQHREREKIKILNPFRSVPTLRVIENSKKIAKNFKNAILSSFLAKIDWKMPRKREYKIYRSVLFLPNA